MQCWFPKQLPHFTFPTAMHKGSNFSTSLPPQHIFFSLFNDTHHRGYAVVSHYGFDLHLFNDWCFLASFHVSIGYSCTFFGEMYIYICINWVVCLFVELQASLEKSHFSATVSPFLCVFVCFSSLCSLKYKSF